MVISTKSDQMIYHESACPYVKRIQKKYIRNVSEGYALDNGYHACSYCGGIHGAYLKYKQNPKAFGYVPEELTASYDRIDKAMCFRTENGFWKILQNKNTGEYKLWHLNQADFSSDIPDKCLMRRNFHRQVDVQGITHLTKIIRYISDHDKAKKIMDDDWKKLPKSTPKQKKYYKQAKKREQKKQHRRVDELFKMLEKGEL